MDEIIGVIKKNAAEEIRVVLSEYRGHELVSIRVFASYDGTDSEKKPTRKGITVRVGQLPALIEALNKAQAARKEGKNGDAD